MDTFKIKHNFYNKNIHIISQLIKKKKRACNMYIYMDTFKIKHKLYHKNINN